MHSDCLGIVTIPEIYKYVTSIKIFSCACDMTMTSDFGKVKSTLGSVVPLAMFFGNIAGEGGVWLASGYGQLCYSGVAS